MKIVASNAAVLRPLVLKTFASDATLAGTIDKPPVVLGRGLLTAALQGQGLIVATPTAATPASDPAPSARDYAQIGKALAASAGKTFTAGTIAQKSWALSSFSATGTPADISKVLVSYHVAPEKAGSIAQDLFKVLNDPITKGVLIAISAGTVTYTVVDKTSWSPARKWSVVLIVAALAAGAFALLRHLGVAA